MQNKVTLDRIKAKIIKEDYVLMPDGRTTICQLTMQNGFTIRGEASCVDISNFDAAFGRSLAYEAAVDAIWPFEGYLLAEELWKSRLLSNL